MSDTHCDLCGANLRSGEHVKRLCPRFANGSKLSEVNVMSEGKKPSWQCPDCPHMKHQGRGCFTPTTIGRLCFCGHGEQVGQRIKELLKSIDKPKPPIRERIEKHLRMSGERLQKAVLWGEQELLRDALNESETWYAMYMAWVKRATEAESTISDLQTKLAESERKLQVAAHALRLIRGHKASTYSSTIAGNALADLEDSTTDEIRE